MNNSIFKELINNFENKSKLRPIFVYKTNVNNKYKFIFSIFF